MLNKLKKFKQNLTPNGKLRILKIMYTLYLIQLYLGNSRFLHFIHVFTFLLWLLMEHLQVKGSHKRFIVLLLIFIDIHDFLVPFYLFVYILSMLMELFDLHGDTKRYVFAALFLITPWFPVMFGEEWNDWTI